MNSISLNGEWKLYYAMEKGGKADTFSPDMMNTWKCIPGNVPGCAQEALVDAGIEEDPYYGENLYAFTRYEYYQWLYARLFFVPDAWKGESIILRFDGIDTIADVYINGKFAGNAANMMVEHEFDISGFVKFGEENEIHVHIHSAMNEIRRQEYTVGMRGTAHRAEICRIRKPPHSFGWDIAPRLVTAGVWRGVSIGIQKPTRILETYFACSRIRENEADLQYAIRFTTDADTLEDFSLRVSGACGERKFEFTENLAFVSANYRFTVKDPALWYPKGTGEAALYEVKTELIHKGEVIDTKKEKIGLRTVRLERDFTPGNQKFKIFVNGQPIFMKGTNWVPLDAMHHRDAQRLEKAFQLIAESGVNIIRCWGGNTYEDHAFFDLCDREGVMVWQDFAMGNTNFPQTPDFVPAIDEEAGKFIKKVRNHPSIAFWCSDNEIDYKNEGFDYPSRESSYNRIAYEVLPRLVQSHDPYRILIKSSPEIPAGFSMYTVPEQHRWGARAWYKDDYYRDINARFISEYGFHGCPAPSSIEKFIPKEQLWPLDNIVWAIHSTEDVRFEKYLNGRNELMAKHVKIMYGDIPDTLEEFALLSQMYQGEAVKYQIERVRMQKWDKTGIIWWNMLDCWPQISDSVVDYYFKKKLAFHYIKRVQTPVCTMISDLRDWGYPVYIANDTPSDKTVSVSVRDADTKAEVFSGTYTVSKNSAKSIGSIPGFISDKKVFLITWTVDNQTYANHFLTGAPAYNPEDMKRWLSEIKNLPEPFEYEA
ncbi:MAG: hypothetical protein IJC48_05760 [Clostridia bacterium]|nr:hypothetical protein [Clostridia bacterium]